MRRIERSCKLRLSPWENNGPWQLPHNCHGLPQGLLRRGFTAGKRDVRVADCRPAIAQDGPIVKFVKRVFNAGYALEERKVVMYITERAVFKLVPTGIELVEVGAGRRRGERRG